jgi:N-methylhydantoinase B/oxoprolinase/acetone carboxylase alpha subunit
MPPIEVRPYQPEIKPAAIVRHPRFGVGKVVARYGEDEKSKVIVKFQEEGEKKLLLKLAKMTVDAPEEEKEAEA